MKGVKKPLIDEDGEVRELGSEDLKEFRPASEVLPRSLQAKLGMRGRGLASSEFLITLSDPLNDY